jgi:hypothetical protein
MLKEFGYQVIITVFCPKCAIHDQHNIDESLLKYVKNNIYRQTGWKGTGRVNRDSSPTFCRSVAAAKLLKILQN